MTSASRETRAIATGKRTSAWIAISALALACDSRSDRDAENIYAKRVTQILMELQASCRDTDAECNKGPLACAVAAHQGAAAARRAKSELTALTPPRKLLGANRKLIDGLDHFAQAYDAIADTFWDRSGAYDAYMRSVELLKQSMGEMASAALELGFKGDTSIWTRR